MSEALYHDALVTAARAGSGAGRLDHPSASVTLDNPLCGDRVTLDLTLDRDRVLALAHLTRGCLLTRAAASVIGELAPGADVAALREASRQLRALLTEDEEPEVAGLSIFRPVGPIRSRHRCVLLPFEALMQAIATAGDEDGSERVPS